MKFTIALVFIAFSAMSVACQKYDCLPPGITLETVVGFKASSSEQGYRKNQPITVLETLRSLKAKCSCKKLVDAKGREIRFFQLKGCWGTPPPDYLEIMENQRNELSLLKKKYTVIEITCSSGPAQRIS